jgi:hypothetical protein
MQVESEKDLIMWNGWFNTIPATSSSSSTNSSTIDGNNKLEGETFLDLEDTSKKSKNFGVSHDQAHYFSSKTKEVIHSAEENENNNIKPKRLTRQARLDSGITTHHLLGDEDDSSFSTDEDRRGSDWTVETLDSCYRQPVLSTSEDYGMNEIMHARQVQQQRLRTNEQTTMVYSRSMILGSITDDEHRLTSSNSRNNITEEDQQQSSFYSSFAGYLSATDSSVNSPSKDSTDLSTN